MRSRSRRNSKRECSPCLSHSSLRLFLRGAVAFFPRSYFKRGLYAHVLHPQSIATASGCRSIILPAQLVRPAHDSLTEILCVCAREACEANEHMSYCHLVHSLFLFHSSRRLCLRGAIAFFPRCSLREDTMPTYCTRNPMEVSRCFERDKRDANERNVAPRGYLSARFQAERKPSSRSRSQ